MSGMGAIICARFLETFNFKGYGAIRSRLARDELCRPWPGPRGHAAPTIVPLGRGFHTHNIAGLQGFSPVDYDFAVPYRGVPLCRSGSPGLAGVSYAGCALGGLSTRDRLSVPRRLGIAGVPCVSDTQGSRPPRSPVSVAGMKAWRDRSTHHSRRSVRSTPASRKSTPRPPPGRSARGRGSPHQDGSGVGSAIADRRDRAAHDGFRTRAFPRDRVNRQAAAIGHAMPGPGRLLRLREVRHIVRLSRSAVYRRIQAGEFPRPVRIGPKAVRWRTEDIEAWLAAHPTRRPSSVVRPIPRPLPVTTVWLRGRRIRGIDASVWRLDHLGRVIRFADYGDRSSHYGWRVVRIDAGGSDDIANLRPVRITDAALTPST